MNTAAKTARARVNPSRPAKALMGYLPKEIYTGGLVTLDYGCGKGTDAIWMNEQGLRVTAYDPYQKGFDDPALISGGSFEMVYSVYVYNVIKDLDEAQKYWENMADLTLRDGFIFVASRTPHEVARSLKVSLLDALQGVTTSKGTFQKGYGHTDIGQMGQSVGLETIKYFGTRSTFSGVLFRKP